MMTIQEMNAIREELGLTYQKICMESGVPIGTVQKVLGGITKNPRMETMQKLEETLGGMKRNIDRYRKGISEGEDEMRRDISPVYGNTSFENPGSAAGMLREVSTVYGSAAKGDSAEKEPHLFTAAEREALPDDRRTELIDGVLYDMASPTMPHQTISRMFTRQIEDCIRERNSKCMIFEAPADVCLDGDDYTVVQPDVFVVCDRKKITRKNIQGAPDFILEILSPSTRKRDKVIKLWKYLNAGVREYWIIDPDKRSVVVFDMTRGGIPDESGCEDPYQISLYGFNDRIPLAIAEGSCMIDMNPIREMLAELYSD